MSNGADRTTYEIGLTMAGAASAGAYAAGVVDFLLEALDRWHRARDERPSKVPDHEVCLKVVTGSSAGGMTGAIAAGLLSGHHTPITSLPGTEPEVSTLQSNPLYSTWVEQIDIRSLLGNEDLSGAEGGVVSLLDSTILDEISKTAINFTPRDAPRDYVADPLHLLLTVTNLKGVPYDITFEGNLDVPHRTARHTDYKEFVLRRDAPDAGRADWLDPSDPQARGWDTLRRYALATGAFPGGLASRTLTRQRADYDDRRWTVPLRPSQVGTERCRERVPIEPSWDPSEREDKEYRFLAVDGGAMNNEPFELARQTLAGEDAFNSRAPTEATRSVLMIDPLPSDRVVGGVGPQDRELPVVLKALFGSLIMQARFKPDELILANSPRVYSRYMIVPTRRDRTGQRADHPIASEMLGGFGGFLKKEFRMHDFQLGRRNCQQFLRKHFGIPRPHCRENPVFSHYSPEQLDRFSVERDGEELMPIIPLVGAAAEEEFPLNWTVLGMDDRELGALEDKIEDRTGRVLNRMVDQYVDGWLPSKLAKLAVGSLAKDRIVKGIMNSVNTDLERYGLKR